MGLGFFKKGLIKVIMMLKITDINLLLKRDGGGGGGTVSVLLISA